MNVILEQINSTGESFTDFALTMLIQSSVLIVILLAIDLLLRKKVRAVLRYWLWMLVLLKLVLPCSLSSPVSLGYLLPLPGLQPATLITPPAKPQPAVVAEPLGAASTLPIEVTPSISSKPKQLAESATVTHTDFQVTAGSAVAISWQGTVFVGWLFVVIALGLLLLQRAFFVKGLVAQAKQAGDLMKDTLRQCCKDMQLNAQIGLKASPNATSPAVCGLFRPVILVPVGLGSDLGKEGQRAVLLHELAHIKRCDLWVNLAQTILQIVYFYNPLLWLANAVIRRIREQAVDEMVLVAMGERAKEYPQTLLEVAKTAFRKPALSLRLIGVVESKSALAGRVKHIVGRPIPKSAKLGILGLIAVVVFGIALLPMWADPGPPTFVIKGTVTDAQTGQPVAGAKIGDNKEYNDGKFSTVTDAKGNYEYKTWYEEHFTKCEAAGYKTEKKILLTKFIGSEKEKIINFALEKGQSEGLEPSIIPAEYVGHWKGQAKIIVNWTKQRWLSIDIDIKPDGTVTGQVGDAQLKNAVLKLRDWLTRKFNPESNWMVRGDLIGHIIKNENIKRDYINLLFDDKFDADGRIKGGFHTSGWHIGGKKTMMMSGTDMVLEKTSPHEPDIAGFTAALSNGVTVELVAVCEHPSEGKQWWRPDGSLLEEAPYKSRKGNPITNRDEELNQLLEFAVRLKGSQSDYTNLRYKVPGATRSGGDGGVKLDGAERIKSIACEISRFLDTGEVHVGVAAGKWEIISTQNADSIENARDESNGRFINWNIPADEQGQAIVIVTHNMAEYESRVVAEDHDGNIIKSPSSTGGGAGPIRTVKYEFPLVLSKVAKFQFQTRPYEWVEFKNVSLKPEFKTEVWVRTVEQESSRAGETPAGQVDGETIFLKRPVELVELLRWRDGGSIGFVFKDVEGKQLQFCLNGRVESKYQGYFFIGATHAERQGAQRIEKQSPEERELLSILRSWVDANFSEQQQKVLLGSLPTELERKEFNAKTILRLLKRYSEQKPAEQVEGEGPPVHVEHDTKRRRAKSDQRKAAGDKSAVAIETLGWIQQGSTDAFVDFMNGQLGIQIDKSAGLTALNQVELNDEQVRKLRDWLTSAENVSLISTPEFVVADGETGRTELRQNHRLITFYRGPNEPGFNYYTTYTDFRVTPKVQWDTGTIKLALYLDHDWISDIGKQKDAQGREIQNQTKDFVRVKTTMTVPNGKATWMRIGGSETSQIFMIIRATVAKVENDYK